MSFRRMSAAAQTVLAAVLLWCWFFGNAARMEEAQDTFARHYRLTDARGRDLPQREREHFAFEDPDAYCWLMYARDAMENGRFRIRRTTWDNVPHGRAMHWCQLPIWGLRALAAGSVRRGEPVGRALETAGKHLMAWTGFIGFFGVFCAVRRLWGAGAAWLALLCGLPMPFVFAHFHPARPDHHGFQLVALAWMWIALLGGRMGWRKAGGGRRRRDAVLFAAAGVCAAVLLWLSATVFLFVFAGTMLALGATFLLDGRGETGVRWDGALWRLWGKVAAGCGLAFYAVEYLPGHFSWRLEVNHPLYAGLLLGAAAAIPALGEWWLERRPMAGKRLARTVLGLAAVLAVPALILFGGGTFHVLRTDTMEVMHRFIMEFRPLLADAHGAAAAKALFGAFGALPLAVAAAFFAAGRGRPTPDRLALLASAAMATCFAGLAMWQIRWASMAGTLCLFPAVLLLAQRPKGRPLVARGVVLGLCLPLGLCAALHTRDDFTTIRNIRECTANNELMFYSVHSRLRAQRLREMAGGADGVPARLCVPISHGPVLAWHRAGQVLGSLYWENLEGVAAFYRAGFDMTEGAETAEAIFRGRGITHLLVDRRDRLPDVTGTDALPLEQRLLRDTDLPAWLEHDREMEAAMRFHFTLEVPPLDGERARVEPLRRLEEVYVYRVLPEADGGAAAETAETE